MDESGNPGAAIFITPENVRTFARAIARIAGVADSEWPDELGRPMTAAERQRKCRNRKRQENVTGVTTCHDDVTNVTLFPHVVKASS